jgi:hypothetical protein
MSSIRYLLLALALAGCSHSGSKLPTATNETLKLTRVFLYRNGIGYFEREGHVDGDTLRIKVRKDQVNDLLKSLTVVNRRGGQAVSISMPLDPQTWANAALATLAPGRGNLAQVLDALRGTTVTLSAADRTIRGRIVMVEEVTDEPDSSAVRKSERPPPAQKDHRITLLDDAKMNVMRLSKVLAVTLEDGDLALQFHRSLDASAGEGMFQQVDVSIRLQGANAHDLLVSYVVSAPMWKPTYRVVLPESGKGKALLQGWAVVDNVSGEEWREVKLGLTSGAPIAFRYDLHTPRDVERADLTETGVRRQAAVAVGETTYAEEPPPPPPAPVASAAAPMQPAPSEKAAEAKAEKEAGKKDKNLARSMKAPAKAAPAGGAARLRANAAGMELDEVALPVAKPEAAPAVDLDSLRRSTLAQAKAAKVSGLTRFDLEPRVTVPDGASTMVAIINQEVMGEETFLFRPGGGGLGYETNPYRVVRFRNDTPFVLESGPIAIYSGGSFVGEGISEAVGAGTSATIPFAVEPGIMVTSTVKDDNQEMRLIRIVRGVLEVDNFQRKTTVYTIKSQTSRPAFTVLVRHAKAGSNYTLVGRTSGTEDLPDAYLVPVAVPRQQATSTVVEQTPNRRSISIWEGRALPLLERLLVATNLGQDARQRLEPIVARRQEIGRIDSQIEELKAQQAELDQRANETRQNLDSIKKDPAAGALRAKLSKRLAEFASDGDRIGRQVVELQTKRMSLRIELEDLLQKLDLTAPPASK